MLVDYERAWRELQAYVQTKSGHGTFGPDGLLAHMAALEVDCKVQEPPTERMVRLLGVQLSSDLITAGMDAPDEEPNGAESSDRTGTIPKGATSNGTSTHRPDPDRRRGHTAAVS